MLKELLWPVRRKRPSRSPTLILFYNTMWDQPLEMPNEPLPAGCEITTDVRRLGEAVAVVFHIPSLRGLPAQRKPRGQIWVAWSMECEANYLQLCDPAYMRRFDMTMTYRLNASVVMPYVWYYSNAENLARALRVEPKEKTHDQLTALFISSTIDQSGRVAYAAELMRYLDVHSYGRILQNRRIEQDRGRATKLDIIAGYKFTLAFENAVGEDYVTEKFYDPLVAGSVPVYLGAPNVDAFAPGERCFINAADFERPKDLADYLLALHHDDAAYGAYFVWKQQPFRTSFLALLAGQETHPFTRLCEAVAQQEEQS